MNYPSSCGGGGLFTVLGDTMNTKTIYSMEKRKEKFYRADYRELTEWLQ